MRNTLIRLAEIHYDIGLIDYDELNERIGVALWLAEELDDPNLDPRTELGEEPSFNEFEESDSNNPEEFVKAKVDGSNDNENWLEFLCLGIWVFTKADPDSYPSVPHGHFKNQNNKWPKLNPYTGRIFSAKHQEDKKQLLSKKQMRKIWSDEKFKSFCREMIIWYQEKFSYYEFPVRRPLRMPRW
tara:strand:+ start:2305 stop:2859 length:555 start_codon:yes stop_codon:yes gene_type:complete